MEENQKPQEAGYFVKFYSKVMKFRALVFQALDLLLTLQAGVRGPRTSKIFGHPDYSGGPMTKYGQLQAACAKRGEPYSTVICLSALKIPLVFLRLLKKFGARITVNQNGVYYPLWCPEGFARENNYLRKLNCLADKSFFQSVFSVESYRKWVGDPPSAHSLLYNAVNRKIFFPDWQRSAESAQLRVLVFLDFRESSRELWLHATSLILGLSLPEVRWVLVGKKEDAELWALLRQKLAGREVEWHTSPTPGELPGIIRGCDVALHFVFNDVCPNKVLECLASGVFVICSSAGGTKELVEKGGGEVISVKEGYQSREYPTTQEVQESLARFQARSEYFRREAFQASEAFDLGDWIKLMTAQDEDDILRKPS